MLYFACRLDSLSLFSSSVSEASGSDLKYFVTFQPSSYPCPLIYSLIQDYFLETLNFGRWATFTKQYLNEVELPYGNFPPILFFIMGGAKENRQESDCFKHSSESLLISLLLPRKLQLLIEKKTKLSSTHYNTDKSYAIKKLNLLYTQVLYIERPITGKLCM